jgi:uncharacterized protein
MNIAITGASGFIASKLKAGLWPGKTVWMSLNRDAGDAAWEQVIMAADVIINLAGAPVIQRWTPRNRKRILESRVQTTRRLVSILNRMDSKRPRLLVSASAIGIYPDQGEKVMTENDYGMGESFLSEVVQQWEQEALKLDNKNTRLVIMRIGVVLGLEGGLLIQTLPLFKRGLGGKIASGKQALSFIHIDDLVAAVQFFIEKKDSAGIYNMVAPHWVSNQYFTKKMAALLRKPAKFTVPALALRILYGKAAGIMINGEKVYPERLLKEGFEFRYPTIGNALSNLLVKK